MAKIDISKGERCKPGTVYVSSPDGCLADWFELPDPDADYIPIFGECVKMVDGKYVNCPPSEMDGLLIKDWKKVEKE